MQFNVHLGDWSNDGHGIQKVFTLEATTANGIRDIRDAYFKIDELLGFKFKSINGEYEEYKMQKTHSDRLVELGVITRADADEYANWVSAEDFLSVLIALLNMVDPTLNVFHPEKEDRIPALHDVLHDDKRYVGHIGYGLFGR